MRCWKRGNSWENAWIRSLSNALTSTRENLAEREAEIGNLSWTQTEKDSALAKCRLGLRAWLAKKPMLCLLDVTDEDGHPLENEDESGRRLCEYQRAIFQACLEGQRHHHLENVLRCVQKAPDDTRWEIDRNEFDELTATKKESALGPDAIPYSLYTCGEDLVRSFSSTHTNISWRVVLFLRYLPKVEPCLFPSPPT